ncbi:PAAR domain-containing protein [Caballeronia glebae]|uniref:PAAR repeat-containing protein n=1 Tax=Caballeronia glebae TaxID=1777143 RepID=A0A158CHZ2_9BURK|nr:PAAR domain-containing protein [Caballeronia glebae]SAK81900.1 PAAR repeat-containing protein [Caballeronia glebae]
MTKPVSLGDATTHGGKVITASSSYFLESRRKVALIDDMVSCPEHGDNPIIESAEGYSEHGRKWAVHMCRTRCGSQVIASGKGVSIK